MKKSFIIVILLYTISAEAQIIDTLHTVIGEDSIGIKKIEQTIPLEPSQIDTSFWSNHSFTLSNTFLSFGKDSKIMFQNSLNWNFLLNEKWNTGLRFNRIKQGSNTSFNYGLRSMRITKFGGIGGVIELSDDLLSPSFHYELNGFTRLKNEFTLDLALSKIYTSKFRTSWISKIGISKLINMKAYGLRLIQSSNDFFRAYPLAIFSITQEPRPNEIIRFFVDAGYTSQPNYNIPGGNSELSQLGLGVWVKKKIKNQIYISGTISYSHYRKDGATFSNILSTNISITIQ